MICDIPVLFGKTKCHTNCIDRSHMKADNPFLSY